MIPLKRDETPSEVGQADDEDRPSCPGFDGTGCAFMLRTGEDVCIVCLAVREGRHKLLMPDGSPRSAARQADPEREKQA